MVLSVLTILTGLVVLYGLLNRHKSYGPALALGGATPAGAAVVVAGIGVPTFYAVAAVLMFGLVLSALARRSAAEPVSRTGAPGLSLLFAFLVWSTFVTLTAPLLFSGLETVTPSAQVLRPGVVTTSNLAQVAYLFLGVGVVSYLARSPRSDPRLLGLALGCCTVLSAWRYVAGLTGVPFPEGVFDNSPTFAFIETAAGGGERFRGILSEPAGLASSSLVTIGYMVPRALQCTGWRCLSCLGLAGVALYLGVVSTSATFVVAGIAVVAIAAATVSIGFLGRRTLLSRLLTIVGCAVAVAGVWLLPLFAGFVDGTISQKLESSSYSDRSSANGDSLAIVLETFGYGVGLGSARASSFLPTLISATGLVGTLLFAGAVATLIYRGSALKSFRPVIWALVALLTVKIASGPDVSDSSGVLWISLGLLSHAARRVGNSVESYQLPPPAWIQPGNKS